MSIRYDHALISAQILRSTGKVMRFSELFQQTGSFAELIHKGPFFVNFRRRLQEHRWKQALLQSPSEMLLSQKWMAVADFFPKERFLGDELAMMSYNQGEER
jgi:hypothetical protein